MKKLFPHQTKTALLTGAAALLVMASTHMALAATQTVTASVKFDTPLTITKNADINFGIVKALQAGTYTISPAGAISASGGGVVLGGTPQAASLTIAGSTSQLIDISVNNYVANLGVTPSAATCSYNNGTAAACSLNSQAAPGAGKTL
ncbi:MAG TPA: DUF4402 domain-containing protein, partial [Alphaproteobacteria bacterium]|nr:DUF4402 domain-containing protein [Alphaproteobacteria bacterium]